MRMLRLLRSEAVALTAGVDERPPDAAGFLAIDCRIRSRRPLSLSESESESATKRRRPALWLRARMLLPPAVAGVAALWE